MTYIDFHAHHPSMAPDEVVIQDGVDTWGIHPWHAQGASLLPAPDGVKYIGECGLDRVCATPWDDQLAAFRHCIGESERLRLPLILHCVRAVDDCLRLRREMHATQPWVWHGFRGNATQLRQLLPHGFSFSFGPHHNVEALRACPLDRLLLETDDQLLPIRPLYEQVSTELSVPVDKLLLMLQQSVLLNGSDDSV